ncbi:MAG: peptide ABC transporter substrate-binding protein, partial [Sphingopyxis sp.]|nr:peptide ABC transporter substrate-binding protein [Sphingopyxis sp.]
MRTTLKASFLILSIAVAAPAAFASGSGGGGGGGGFGSGGGSFQTAPRDPATEAYARGAVWNDP